MTTTNDAAAAEQPQPAEAPPARLSAVLEERLREHLRNGQTQFSDFVVQTLLAEIDALRAELVAVRERIAADPDESTLAALDLWFVENRAAEKQLNAYGEAQE